MQSVKLGQREQRVRASNVIQSLKMRQQRLLWRQHLLQAQARSHQGLMQIRISRNNAITALCISSDKLCSLSSASPQKSICIVNVAVVHSCLVDTILLRCVSFVRIVRTSYSRYSYSRCKFNMKRKTRQIKRAHASFIADLLWNSCIASGDLFYDGKWIYCHHKKVVY